MGAACGRMFPASAPCQTPWLKSPMSAFLFCATLLAVPVAPADARSTPSELQRQVMEAERAFAKSMADRDLEAFAQHLSEEAVFFGQRMLRGNAEVVEGWRPFFEGPDAPFSWEPEQVEVLPSGTLAHSSGPVFDPEGTRVATFNSIWRLEGDGRWRVIFDKGCSCPGG